VIRAPGSLFQLTSDQVAHRGVGHKVNSMFFTLMTLVTITVREKQWYFNMIMYKTI